MKRQTFGGAVVSASALAVSLLLTAAAPPEKPVKPLLILTEADVDASRLLPPPPPIGSPADALDRRAVRLAIDADTPQRFAQARWDDEHENTEAFYEVIGGGFDLKRLPQTRAVLEAALNETSAANDRAKLFFARKRPWVDDPSIKDCNPNDKPLRSYPSGHATMAYTAALILADLMPQKAQAILSRAADYGYSRVLCGAHYPSDVAGSQTFAAELVLKMRQNPGFAGNLDRARVELRDAGFLKR